uniref:At1g61320/AtMIF1 LRR domain-containing protein n=1 Tax=Oryza punctata TaxID=4537 RepID=A0A0E0KW21_ORYPU
MPSHLNQLNSLLVSVCPLLQEIKLNCDVTVLDYRGPLIPLQLAIPSQITNVSLNLSTLISALGFIFRDFPSTLPNLETLTLKLKQVERDNLIGGLPRLISLRHLTLELIICDLPQRKIDMVMICKHTGIVQMMIEGFFGEKDQLELALHILQNANGSQRNDDRHKFEVRICRSVLFARMCCFLWL